MATPIPTSRRRRSRPLATLVLVGAVVAGGVLFARYDGRIGSTVPVELNVRCSNLIHFTDGDDSWWAGDDPRIDGSLRNVVGGVSDDLASGTITFETDGSVTFRSDAGGSVRLEREVIDDQHFHTLACSIPGS